MNPIKLFRALFPKKVLIYSAIGPSDNSKVVGRLIDHGVKYYTKIEMTAARHRELNQDLNKIYDIYVLEEEKNKAVEALNKR